MTRAAAPRRRKSPLRPDEIAAWLAEHPEFFLEHGAMLADMALPPQEGPAVSLKDHQIKVLRNRNAELRHKLGELMQIARDNDHIFRLIRHLGLALLQARTLTDATRAIHDNLITEFKCDFAQLFLHEAGIADNTAFATSLNANAIREKLGDLANPERISCCALRAEEMRFLFGDGIDGSGSAVLIPLNTDKLIGLLVIGSRDVNHYHGGMDTHFVEYMGDAIARRLSHFTG